MTPDLTSVISSSDLLKYLILIKTIDTHLLHLLLSGRTFYSDEVTRPFLKKGTCLIPPIQRKGIRPALHSPPPETHAGARNPEHPNISLFARRTSVLIILIKIPAPIIQHLYREKQKGPDYFRNQGPYKKGSYLLSHIALQYHRRNRA